MCVRKSWNSSDVLLAIPFTFNSMSLTLVSWHFILLHLILYHLFLSFDPLKSMKIYVQHPIFHITTLIVDDSGLVYMPSSKRCSSTIFSSTFRVFVFPLVFWCRVLCAPFITYLFTTFFFLRHVSLFMGNNKYLTLSSNLSLSQRSLLGQLLLNF